MRIGNRLQSPGAGREACEIPPCRNRPRQELQGQSAARPKRANVACRGRVGSPCERGGLPRQPPPWMPQEEPQRISSLNTQRRRPLKKTRLPISMSVSERRATDDQTRAPFREGKGRGLGGPSVHELGDGAVHVLAGLHALGDCELLFAAGVRRARRAHGFNGQQDCLHRAAS